MVRASFENKDWTIRSKVVQKVRETFTDVQVTTFSTHTNEVVFITPQNRVEEIERIIQNVIINKNVEYKQTNQVLTILATYGAKLETDINVLDENYNLVKTNKIETVYFGPCHIGKKQYCFRIPLIYNEDGDINIDKLVYNLNHIILTIREFIRKENDIFMNDYQAQNIISRINVILTILDAKFKDNRND